MVMWIALVAGGAWAQDLVAPELNAQLYHAPIDARRTLWADDTGWSPGTSAQARLVFGYARDPLVFEYDDGTTARIVGDLVQANALGSLTFGRVRVGVDVPVTLAMSSDVSPSRSGLGDVALDLKANALDRGRWGTGLAFGLRATLPTSVVDGSLGDSVASVEMQAIGDGWLNRDWFLTGNIGQRVAAVPGDRATTWLVRPFARAGLGRMVGDSGGISLDVAGMAGQQWPIGEPSGVPIEALLGGWVRLGEGLVVRGGVGRGLTQGIGAPQARSVLSVGWEPPREQDTDLDGIMDRLDECVDEPEDRDHFRDLDGCPDLDNDQDGVPDVVDACPMDAEDLDGFEDQDGCAEAATRAHIRVNGPDGRVLESAHITITGAGISPKWGDGDYRVILDPGSYAVHIEAEGYRPTESTLVVEPGKSVELVRSLATEAPIGRLELAVYGEHGRALQGAMVAADGGPFVPLAGRDEWQAGPWRLDVRAPGFGAAQVRLTVTAGLTSSAELVLQAPRVRVEGSEVLLGEAVDLPVNGDTIGVASHRLLDDLAGLLIDDPTLRILIVGAADTAGATPSPDEVGVRRAEAVKAWIVARGVSGERVQIRGDSDANSSPIRVTVLPRTP